jgi:hypothetical protein
MGFWRGYPLFDFGFCHREIAPLEIKIERYGSAKMYSGLPYNGIIGGHLPDFVAVSAFQPR